jgi:hypothetical protein
MPAKLNIEMGSNFGRLTVVDIIHNKKGRQIRCQCECGNLIEVYATNLIHGATLSCGCLHSEIMFKHGQSKNPIYSVYRGMIKRCYNINHKSYKDYGGRGIAVCDEWLGSFIAFYTWAIESGYDNGLTLDREDNNMNYSPDNCRWVNLIIQANNRRDNVWYNFNDTKMTLAQICRYFGIIDKRRLVKQRIQKYGWNLIDAINAYL